MEALEMIWKELNWEFIILLVLSGRIVTNWADKGAPVPKPWVILTFASVIGCLFILGETLAGNAPDWTSYLHSYVFAAVFYQHIGKYLLDEIEPIIITAIDSFIKRRKT